MSDRKLSVVKDGDEKVELNSLYDDYMRDEAFHEKIKIKGHDFELLKNDTFLI